jgi:sugar/nucleoside kinase (ribokinase family)
MSGFSLDVVAMGNALVDVLANVTDEFIAGQETQHGMKPGAMTLIDEIRAVELYAQMPSGIESSGGSAGNTIAGLASFGGRGAFIGKVAQDQLGSVFRHDLESMGVVFETTPIIIGAKTGRCLVLVSPDGQRTMNTYLGAATTLSTDDVDEELIASAAITYLEGYLFDPDHAKNAFRKASDIARAAGRKVALTLSDPFCVGRHRDDFLDFVEGKTDILFANEAEIMSLYQTATFEEAAHAVGRKCDLAVVTRSEKGSVIVADGRMIDIKPDPAARIIDTTGAGDQYAAGFLYGLSRGLMLETCGRLGSMAAAEVISHMGPRPGMKYAEFLKKAA